MLGGNMASKRARQGQRGGAGIASAPDVARLNAILNDEAADAKISREFQARADAFATGKSRGRDEAAELLCWAAGNGRADIVAKLLERGADPNGAVTLTLPPY